MGSAEDRETGEPWGSEDGDGANVQRTHRESGSRRREEVEFGGTQEVQGHDEALGL